MKSKSILVLVCALLTISHQAEASCGPNIPGDVSGDCKVDFNDFAIMASGWFMSGEPYEWADRYNGPGNGDDSAKAIAIDSNNNVYVTGYSEGVAKDYATIRYSPDYTCTPQLDGDLNDDCKVDFFDVAILASNWLECNLDPPSACLE